MSEVLIKIGVAKEENDNSFQQNNYAIMTPSIIYKE